MPSNLRSVPPLLGGRAVHPIKTRMMMHGFLDVKPVLSPCSFSCPSGDLLPMCSVCSCSPPIMIVTRGIIEIQRISGICSQVADCLENSSRKSELVITKMFQRCVAIIKRILLTISRTETRPTIGHLIKRITTRAINATPMIGLTTYTKMFIASIERILLGMRFETSNLRYLQRDCTICLPLLTFWRYL